MSKLTAKINLQQVFEGSVTTIENAFKGDVMTAKNGKDYIPLEVLKGKRWLCIDDLAGDHFFLKKNNDIQLQFEISKKRETDQFGNTHSLSLLQSKTTRESNARKVYIGDAKEIDFSKIKTAENTAENIISQANLKKLEEVDELDF